MIKRLLKKNLSNSSTRKLRNYVNDFKAVFLGGNLNKIGKIYGTDKIGEHFYTPHYMTHLKKFRFK